MSVIKRLFSKIPSIKNKYPLMVAATFLIYIFAFVFLIIFAVSAGPSILSQQTAVTSVPKITFLNYEKDFAIQEINNDNIHTSPLMVVNDNYKCEIDGVNLTKLLENSNSKYKVADYDVQVNSSIVENVNNMFGKFHQLYGENDIMVNSGYRSSEVQKRLYDEDVSQREDGNKSSEYVAKSGYSEHQTGYSFDLSLLDSNGIITEYNGEDKYKWINENCSEYGFIVRYPKDKTEYTGYNYEPWHFRYVGVPHASYIAQNSLCLEEYVTLLKSHTIQDPLFVTDLSMTNWQIYFVPADGGNTTRVPVPKDNEYQVYGNNIDGFIVSVKL